MTCSILPNCEPACDHGGVLRPGRHLHPGGAADPAGPGRGRADAAGCHHRGARRRGAGVGRPRLRADRERDRGDGQRDDRRADPRRRPAHPARGGDGHPPPPHGPARARRWPTSAASPPIPTRWPSARSSWPGTLPDGRAAGRQLHGRRGPAPRRVRGRRRGGHRAPAGGRALRPGDPGRGRRGPPGEPDPVRPAWPGTRVPKPTGHDKTSIVCFQRADHPGSLHGILGQFAARNINLTKLESRPDQAGAGRLLLRHRPARPRRRRGGGRLPA